MLLFQRLIRCNSYSNQYCSCHPHSIYQPSCSAQLPSTLPQHLPPHGSVIKNPPAMQFSQGPSLGWEDSLKEETAIYSSILAWKMSWTEELWQARVQRVTKSQTEWLSAHIYSVPSTGWSSLHAAWFTTKQEKRFCFPLTMEWKQFLFIFFLADFQWPIPSEVTVGEREIGAELKKRREIGEKCHSLAKTQVKESPFF